MADHIGTTITNYQFKNIEETIGRKSSIMAAAVIRLFTGGFTDRKWIYSGLCGGLCFVIDRSLGGVPVFRMLDLNTYEFLFEYEQHINFCKSYIGLNDYFYYFDMKGGLIGFSFADSNDAEIFLNLVNKYNQKPSKKKVKSSKNHKQDKSKSFLALIYKMPKNQITKVVNTISTKLENK